MSYPPPPGSEEPHYTPIYAAPPPANPPPPPPQPPATPQGQSHGQSQSRSQADDHDIGNPNGAGPPPRAYTQDLFPKMDGLGDVLQQQAQHASHALSNDHGHGHGPVHVHTPVQPAPQHAPTASPVDHHHKTNRLRKACDSCSIRKVKCDESGPPCRACAALDIPCTFERPSRRRGPPNRHAEAIKKRRRLEGGDLGSGASNPASPTNAAHALAQLSSLPPQLSAESICPLPTMNALIDDFFTYIHPLCPFPHEPSFREAWESREDSRNPSFLALLASMIAAMVASFPRRPRLHIKQQSRDQYPSHLSLVDKCREVCAQARGPGYLDKPSLNVYDACTSYFLGLVGGYTFQWRQMRLYIGECLTILRSLGLHKTQEQRYTPFDGLAASESNEPNFAGSRDLRLDKITEQIGRRVFWTAFAGARTTQQLGASFGELTILPSTPTEALPPLPLEVDDACIFPNEIMAQPLGVVPEITGFNINTRVYLSYDALTTCEMAFGCDELFDWDQQQRMLESCLHRCKSVLDNIPDVLRVQPQGLRQRRQPYYPPIPEYLNMREPGMAVNGPDSPESRRAIQYEIQKANIYASHLSIRSYLVEKYFTLLEKSNMARTQMARHSSPSAPTSGLDRLFSSAHIDAAALEKQMSEEREQVFKDLLVVLGSIDMVNMEPNGDSLTQKIRSIARTLLEVPKERRGSVAQQHQDYLYKFLDILGKLERVNPEGSDPSTGPVDEEAELRHWADLREYQLKFQEQGGVYSYS